MPSFFIFEKIFDGYIRKNKVYENYQFVHFFNVQIPILCTTIAEMAAEELEAKCRTFVSLQAKDMELTKELFERKYLRVTLDNDYIRVYDDVKAEAVVTYLYENGILVTEIKTDKIGLEEYYIDLMKEVRR